MEFGVWFEVGEFVGIAWLQLERDRGKDAVESLQSDKEPVLWEDSEDHKEEAALVGSGGMIGKNSDIKLILAI